MNVEMISTLEQVKSMLSRAYNAADRQLRNPFGDKESVSSYLLTKIQIVTNEIDAFISEEENAFEAYYSEDESTNVNISIEAFPLDEDSEIPEEGVVCRRRRVNASHARIARLTVTPKSNGFNPVIHDCASEITAAFGDCWVEVKALKPNGSHPEYMISIQPSGYNPNDIQLKLKSLGYTPAFKKINDYPNSAWVYFDVSLNADRSALSSTNGIAFELSSTVSEVSPPEFDRCSEPATDSELPF